MANLRWIKHVRAYAKKHNITYMCAIGKASATYKKTKRTKPKAVKKTKPKPVKKTKPKAVKKEEDVIDINKKMKEWRKKQTKKSIPEHKKALKKIYDEYMDKKQKRLKKTAKAKKEFKKKLVDKIRAEKSKTSKKKKIKNKNVKDIIKLIQKFYDFEKGAHLKVIHNTLKNQYREMKGWTNAEINEAFDRLPNKDKYF